MAVIGEKWGRGSWSEGLSIYLCNWLFPYQAGIRSGKRTAKVLEQKSEKGTDLLIRPIPNFSALPQVSNIGPITYSGWKNNQGTQTCDE